MIIICKTSGIRAHKGYIESAINAVQSGGSGGSTLIWTERRDASFLNVLEASWPQAPKDSTSGMQLQPRSSQIPEFSCTLRRSVANAAEPAVCPASETMSGFSGVIYEFYLILIKLIHKKYTTRPTWTKLHVNANGRRSSHT